MVISEIYTQLAFKPPVPTADVSGKTIIVTGANAGLGKEAVKHFVRLNAAKVVATARSAAKGATALAEIEAETKRASVVEFWDLDNGSYASVKAFCARAAQLERLDAVVLNAGVGTYKFEIFEQDESSITVNVINTTLLALPLLPALRASAAKWDTVPTLSITSSAIYMHAKYPERTAPNSLEALSDPKTLTMSERYAVPLAIFPSCFSPESTQLPTLTIAGIREIAARTADRKPFVIINMVSPGLCKTDLTRSADGIIDMAMKVGNVLLVWTAEEGSRTLVHATIAGPESHDILLSECSIKNKALATQKKFWGELTAKLEGIQPGITIDL